MVGRLPKPSVRLREVQHFLDEAHWDADTVRDDLREYVVVHLLGDEKSGVPIVDEPDFLEERQQVLGVVRQYTGTVGRRENCEVSMCQ